MNLPTTADLQTLTRPLLDEVFAALGQTVTVRVAQPAPVTPGGLPPADYDEFGRPLTSPPADPTPDAHGTATVLGTFPCLFEPLDARGRAAVGADLATPLWQGIIHHSAPLDRPGLTFTVSGGTLASPLALIPLGDVVDIGAQGVAWSVVAGAPDALRG